MSRWTHLQEEIRHRFGLDEDVEGGGTFGRGGKAAQIPVGDVPESPSPSTLPEQCWWPGCDLLAQRAAGRSFEEFSIREMLCRTHHIDLIVGSLWTEHLLDAAFHSTVAGLE